MREKEEGQIEKKEKRRIKIKRKHSYLWNISLSFPFSPSLYFCFSPSLPVLLSLFPRPSLPLSPSFSLPLFLSLSLFQISPTLMPDFEKKLAIFFTEYASLSLSSLSLSLSLSLRGFPPPLSICTAYHFITLPLYHFITFLLISLSVSFSPSPFFTSFSLLLTASHSFSLHRAPDTFMRMRRCDMCSRAVGTLMCATAWTDGSG